MFVPSSKNLDFAIENNIRNFSFITSVSSRFLEKNINMTLTETKEELHRMIDKVTKIGPEKMQPKIKLYISCINKCPITGFIDNDYILNQIFEYNKIDEIGEICLSDTCGELSFHDFEYIIDACLFFGIPPSKLSLHLHIRKEVLINIKKIVQYALDLKINKFDISILETGGCVLTMDKNSELLKPNMTYELFYQILVDYIEKNK
jgi:hypothetical protein